MKFPLVLVNWSSPSTQIKFLEVQLQANCLPSEVYVFVSFGRAPLNRFSIWNQECDTQHFYTSTSGCFQRTTIKETDCFHFEILMDRCSFWTLRRKVMNSENGKLLIHLYFRDFTNPRLTLSVTSSQATCRRFWKTLQWLGLSGTEGMRRTVEGSVGDFVQRAGENILLLNVGQDQEDDNWPQPFSWRRCCAQGGESQAQLLGEPTDNKLKWKSSIITK